MTKIRHCKKFFKLEEVLVGFSLKVCVLVAQSCLTLLPHGLQPTRFLCPWDFPGKNTGVGCHFLLPEGKRT